MGIRTPTSAKPCNPIGRPVLSRSSRFCCTPARSCRSGMGSRSARSSSACARAKLKFAILTAGLFCRILSSHRCISTSGRSSRFPARFPKGKVGWPMTAPSDLHSICWRCCAETSATSCCPASTCVCNTSGSSAWPTLNSCRAVVSASWASLSSVSRTVTVSCAASDW